MKRALGILVVMGSMVLAATGAEVVFSTFQLSGAPNNRPIQVEMDGDVVLANTNLFYSRTMTLQPVAGIARTNLVCANYIVILDGKRLKMPVPAGDGVYSAAELITSGATVMNAALPAAYLQQVQAMSNAVQSQVSALWATAASLSGATNAALGVISQSGLAYLTQLAAASNAINVSMVQRVGDATNSLNAALVQRITDAVNALAAAEAWARQQGAQNLTNWAALSTNVLGAAGIAAGDATNAAITVVEARTNVLATIAWVSGQIAALSSTTGGVSSVVVTNIVDIKVATASNALYTAIGVLGSTSVTVAAMNAAVNTSSNALALQIAAVSGGPTNGITAETATNAATTVISQSGLAYLSQLSAASNAARTLALSAVQTNETRAVSLPRITNSAILSATGNHFITNDANGFGLDASPVAGYSMRFAAPIIVSGNPSFFSGISPNAGYQYDLGTTGAPWRVFYASNSTFSGTVTGNLGGGTNIPRSGIVGLENALSFLTNSGSAAPASKVAGGTISTNQFALLATLPGVNRLANGGLPPLGYVTYNAYPYPSANEPTEDKMKAVALRMRTNGLYSLGYKYLVIDEGWQGTRAGDGTPGFNTNFPNGIKPVIDYVHGLGMKIGLYFFTGPFANGGSPGSHGYWREDAHWAATNGVDYIKLEGYDIPDSPYTSYLFQSAIQESGRDIYTCIGGNHFEAWMRNAGNSWRYAGDYGDVNTWGETVNWWDAGLTNNWGNGRGNFNEVDEITWNILGKTRVSMAAILPAPILISELVLAGNPSDLEAHKEFYTNSTVIAINQDGGHNPGVLVSRTHGVDVVRRYLGDVVDGNLAVLVLNRNHFATNCTVYFTNLGLAAASQMVVEDVWNRTNHTATGSFPVALGVGSNDVGVALFRLSQPVSTVAGTYGAVTDYLSPAQVVPDKYFTPMSPAAGADTTPGGNPIGWQSTNAVGIEHRLSFPVAKSATNVTIEIRATANRASERITATAYFARYNNDDSAVADSSQAVTLLLAPGRVDTYSFTGTFANTNVGKTITVIFSAGTNALNTIFYIVDATRRTQWLADGSASGGGSSVVGVTSAEAATIAAAAALASTNAFNAALSPRLAGMVTNGDTRALTFANSVQASMFTGNLDGTASIADTVTSSGRLLNWEGSVSGTARRWASPTNAMASLVVDMSKSSVLTNLAGNVTIAGVAWVSSTNLESTVIRLRPNGADRVVTLPASVITPNGARSFTVTNSTYGETFLTLGGVQGERTNATWQFYY